MFLVNDGDTDGCDSARDGLAIAVKCIRWVGLEMPQPPNYFVPRGFGIAMLSRQAPGSSRLAELGNYEPDSGIRVHSFPTTALTWYLRYGDKYIFISYYVYRQSDNDFLNARIMR